MSTITNPSSIPLFCEAAGVVIGPGRSVEVDAETAARVSGTVFAVTSDTVPAEAPVEAVPAPAPEAPVAALVPEAAPVAPVAPEAAPQA